MQEERKEKRVSRPNSRNVSPRGSPPGSASIDQLHLLSSGDALIWGTDRFTRMNSLTKLTLQGHSNAVEFFGINLRTLKYLEVDTLDELR